MRRSLRRGSLEGVGQGVPGGQGPGGAALLDVDQGAAGQAVQNMNLMYGWKEEEGLL